MTRLVNLLDLVPRALGIAVIVRAGPCFTLEPNSSPAWGPVPTRSALWRTTWPKSIVRPVESAGIVPNAAAASASVWIGEQI